MTEAYASGFEVSEVILPSEWSDGCYTEMMVYKDSMEIIMRYLRSGKRISVDIIIFL